MFVFLAQSHKSLGDIRLQSDIKGQHLRDNQSEESIHVW